LTSNGVQQKEHPETRQLRTPLYNTCVSQQSHNGVHSLLFEIVGLVLC